MNKIRLHSHKFIKNFFIRVSAMRPEIKENSSMINMDNIYTYNANMTTKKALKTTLFYFFVKSSK